MLNSQERPRVIAVDGLGAIAEHAQPKRASLMRPLAALREAASAVGALLAVAERADGPNQAPPGLYLLRRWLHRSVAIRGAEWPRVPQQKEKAVGMLPGICIHLRCWKRIAGVSDRRYRATLEWREGKEVDYSVEKGGALTEIGSIPVT